MLLGIDEIILGMIGGVMEYQLFLCAWSRDDIIFYVQPLYPFTYIRRMRRLREQFEFK